MQKGCERRKAAGSLFLFVIKSFVFWKASGHGTPPVRKKVPVHLMRLFRGKCGHTVAYVKHFPQADFFRSPIIMFRMVGIIPTWPITRTQSWRIMP